MQLNRNKIYSIDNTKKSTKWSEDIEYTHQDLGEDFGCQAKENFS